VLFNASFEVPHLPFEINNLELKQENNIFTSSAIFLALFL
tara:strand:- start:2963 stop:3082 length:120 start_codon:yes stop_codon:yes gene_type:complete